MVWGVILLIPPPAANVPQPPAGAGQGQAPQAIAPPAVDIFFQRIRADLDSADVFVRRNALERLATMRPNAQRAEVARKLVELTELDDANIRRPAVLALGVWGSEDEVPALLKAVEHTDVFTRREALKVIGRYRHGDIVSAVIPCFRDFHTRAEADKALRELGPRAEQDVLTLLTERDVFLRKAAIEVLTDIGSEASVPALREAANSNRVLVEPAQQAMAAIANRRKQ
jgi:HEAT repeat protein